MSVPGRRSRGGPWLSVLMPVYNGDRYLEAALESVADQGGRDELEVIAVDDGSSDDTLAILAAWQGRLRMRLVEREHKGNWVENTNHALALARGAWVCVLHQDDLWLPGRLATARRLAERHPEAGLLAGPSWYVGPDGRRVGTWRCGLPLRDAPLAPDEVLERLLVQNTIAMPAPVFRRELALRLGGLDPELWYTADWDLWLKLAAAAPTVCWREYRTAFRLHGESQTSLRTERIDEVRRQLETALRRHLQRWEVSAPTRAAVERTALLSIDLNLALAALRHSRRGRARALARLLALLARRDILRCLRRARVLERALAQIRVRMRARDSAPASASA